MTTRGAKIGQKYLKSALKRLAREQPEKLEKACRLLLDDMAGETEVTHASVYEGVPTTYKLPINPTDRHRALALFGDRVDGKPLQELRTEGGATTNVIVVRAGLEEDPALPPSVQAILDQRKREEEGIDFEDDEDDD